MGLPTHKGPLSYRQGGNRQTSSPNRSNTMRSRRDGLTPRDASPVPSSEAVCCGQTDTNLTSDTAIMSKSEGTSSQGGNYAEQRIISPSRRVAVFAPDGQPLMPTKMSRARKWIKSGKATPTRTKLNLFGVILADEPSGKETQPIVMGIDPGSKYTGIAVQSKKETLCGFNLELPTWVHKRMEIRTLHRKHRKSKKRSRAQRVINRHECDLPPALKARKQLELRVATELSKTYPISVISYETVYNKKYKRGKVYKEFSLAMTGKNWVVGRLKKISPLRMHPGWIQARQREKLGLMKTKVKEERNPTSHVHDAIALTSLHLGDIIITQFPFDIISRPKYIRRKLHMEQPSKGGIRRSHGGTTLHQGIRSGDMLYAVSGSNKCYCIASGYCYKHFPNGSYYHTISGSDSEWNRIAKFFLTKLRLIRRNTGLIVHSLFKSNIPQS